MERGLLQVQFSIFIPENGCEGSVKVHLEYCYNSSQRARGGKSALRKTLKLRAAGPPLLTGTSN